MSVLSSDQTNGFFQVVQGFAKYFVVEAGGGVGALVRSACAISVEVICRAVLGDWPGAWIAYLLFDLFAVANGFLFQVVQHLSW